MKHETDERQDQNDMNERPGDMKEQADSPEDNEKDSDDGEHKSKVNSASLVSPSASASR